MMKGAIDKPRVQMYSYRNSDIEWLGDIPGTWKLLRASYVFKIINERSKSGEEELLSVSEHHGVRPRSEANVNMFMAESYKGYKLCMSGDLVINSLWAWSRGLGFSKYKGIVSTAYSVYRPDHENYDKDYLDYLLRTDIYVAQYVIASKGIWISRLQLSDWAFLRLPILSPPKPEQTRIAQFLDRKTAQIDKAIAQKEKLIELLKERRQILIHNAVTRGLNPNVKMKDSGVEWIGEIPGHWEVMRMKYIFDQIQTGTTPPTNNSSFFDGNINWFNPSDLNNEELRESGKKLARLAIDRGEIKLFPADSILIVGIGGTTGKTSYLPISGTFNQQITGLHSKVHYNKYFFYALSSMSGIMLNTANYTTLPILNNQFFKSFFLSIPPLKEQQEIVRHIEIGSMAIYKAIKYKQREIEKLKEFKATLINSTVTGKIKVS